MNLFKPYQPPHICFADGDDDPDANVLAGGPEDGDPAADDSPPSSKAAPGAPTPSSDDPPVTPELIEIEVQGVKMMLTQEQIDALDAERESIAAAPAGDPDPTPAPTQAPQAKDIGELLFTNPGEAVEAIAQAVSQKVNAGVSADRFWDRFYAEHTDFNRAEDDFLVQAVMNKSWNDLKDLPGPKASAKLAELAKKEILRFSKGSDKGDADPAATVESGGPRTPKTESKPKEEPPKTLSQTLKERRKSRLEQPATKAS